jgi:hypothetical protein
MYFASIRLFIIEYTVDEGRGLPPTEIPSLKKISIDMNNSLAKIVKELTKFC